MLFETVMACCVQSLENPSIYSIAPVMHNYTRLNRSSVDEIHLCNVRRLQSFCKIKYLNFLFVQLRWKHSDEVTILKASRTFHARSYSYEFRRPKCSWTPSILTWAVYALFVDRSPAEWLELPYNCYVRKMILIWVQLNRGSFKRMYTEAQKQRRLRPVDMSPSA